MNKIRDLFRAIPRRYRHYPFLVTFICLIIFFLTYLHRSPQIPIEIVTPDITINETINATESETYFDLFDDDNRTLLCSDDVHFNITNRQHLAIIVAPKLVPFIWKNFLGLLCAGVDAYVMLDQMFSINSSVRADGFSARSNRSILSYTHRFLYVSDQALEKYGVRYMMKFPKVEFTAWDRAVVWLYHRRNLTNAWIMEYGVQWFHVGNMTYVFDLYAADKTDLLCADVVETGTTFWQNWPVNQSDILPKSYWTGTYSPLVRWSRQLLLHHYRYMQLLHKRRLNYEMNLDFRFKEYIMGTIAKIENLSINMYNKKYHFIHMSLGNYNDSIVLRLLQQGQHIIFPVTYNSILTRYQTQEIAQLIATNKIVL